MRQKCYGLGVDIALKRLFAPGPCFFIDRKPGICYTVFNERDHENIV